MACAMLTSCFKDEAPNAECDILQTFVHVDNPSKVFAQLTDSVVDVMSSNSDIVFNIKPGADVSKMAPQFKLTEGASIYPESGTEFDFSNDKKVAYTVTSEDKAWTRKYNVSFEIAELPTKFSFENCEIVTEGDIPKYYVWYDMSPNGKKIYDWATGNAGYKLSAREATPEEYPSVSVDEGNGPENGKFGKYVKLTTRSTGLFGVMAKRRLAAGNLFIGVFDVNKALTNTMLTTRFGLPFGKKPSRLTGYFKYKPGENFQDRNGKIVDGKIDRGDIYAVLYRNHDANGEAMVLNGDDVKTNANIVALAEVNGGNGIEETSDWQRFDAAFDYMADFDEELMENNGYSIAIVCTSGTTGASFEGAVGSTLYVDEFEIVCE